MMNVHLAYGAVKLIRDNAAVAAATKKKKIKK
jgi:hypothetical protein